MKTTIAWAAATASLILPGGVSAAQTPRAAPVQVFEAAKLDHQAISRRALVCIPKFATSGLTTADTIVSSDVDAGYIQARNVWSGGFGGGLSYRSTITLEAKDGRFRISHSDLGVTTGRSSWGVMRFPGAGEIAHMQSQSFNIASCIQKGPVSDEF